MKKIIESLHEDGGVYLSNPFEVLGSRFTVAISTSGISKIRRSVTGHNWSYVLDDLTDEALELEGKKEVTVVDCNAGQRIVIECSSAANITVLL